MKPRLILFGTSAFGVPSFQRLLEADRWHIVAVVTQPARPVGRKQELTPSSVATWAQSAGLSVLTPSSLKQPEPQGQLRELRPDLFVVASYGLILPQPVLDIPGRGSLNIHASLLPRYRGASPIAGAIADGDATTGITFMVMDAGCDTGPILQQTSLSIRAEETKPELEERLSRLAAGDIVTVVKGWLNETLTARPQPTDGVTLAPRLTRESGRCDWQDAHLLERRIRAYRPWPGVWTTFNNKELKIHAATADDTTLSIAPGTVVEHNGGWGIACVKGVLVPSEVQLSGKSPQPATSIPGSYPGFVGAVLS